VRSTGEALRCRGTFSVDELKDIQMISKYHISVELEIPPFFLSRYN
jgi:hypothetical protein